MSQYKTADEISYAETKQRLENLPEKYMIAIEEIVDNLDKDWQNRVIYTKYLAKLCDIFEEAQAQNQSVEDVCGYSVKEYAREFQAKYDFRELEATDFSKVLNTILLYNGVLVFSSLTLISPLKQFYLGTGFSMQSVLFMVIGIIIASIALLLKSKFYKQQHMESIHLLVSLFMFMLMVGLGVVSTQGNMYTFIGLAIICVYDFVTTKKQYQK